MFSLAELDPGFVATHIVPIHEIRVIKGDVWDGMFITFEGVTDSKATPISLADVEFCASAYDGNQQLVTEFCSEILEAPQDNIIRVWLNSSQTSLFKPLPPEVLAGVCESHLGNQSEYTFHFRFRWREYAATVANITTSGLVTTIEKHGFTSTSEISFSNTLQPLLDERVFTNLTINSKNTFTLPALPPPGISPGAVTTGQVKLLERKTISQGKIVCFDSKGACWNG